MPRRDGRRDVGRGRLYKAEREFAASLPPEHWLRQPWGHTKEELGNAVRRIERVMGYTSPQLHTFKVYGTGNRGRANEYWISLGRGAANWVLLHELAHSFAGVWAMHQRPFRAKYLEMVEKFGGQYAARQFRKYLRKHRVSDKPPRKRAISPERRQQLKAQIEKAREARLAKYEVLRTECRVVRAVPGEPLDCFSHHCWECSSLIGTTYVVHDEVKHRFCAVDCAVRYVGRKRRKGD